MTCGSHEVRTLLLLQSVGIIEFFDKFVRHSTSEFQLG